MSDHDKRIEERFPGMAAGLENAAAIVREFWDEQESNGLLESIRESLDEELQTLRDRGIEVPGDDGVTDSWLDVCAGIGVDPESMTNIEMLTQAIRGWVWRTREEKRIEHSLGGEDQYVTLDQAAATVQRSKQTLRKRKRKRSGRPAPDVKGGAGKPDEWKWSTIRPWLEKEFDRKLPEQYPKL